MLVLTRSVGERVMLDDSIIVSVERVRGDKVVLGFVAPADVEIFREEVYNLRAQERKEVIQNQGQGESTSANHPPI